MDQDNARMPAIKDIRQRRVRELIRAEFEGKQVLFADRIGKPDNYVSRILSNGPNRKGIGETVAREIEQKCGKPPRWLDDVAGDGSERRRSTLFGLPISETAVAVGRDWDKLAEPLKTQIADLIQTLASAQIRLDRARTPKREGDRPSA
jgi:hypothetical protein